MIQPPTSRPPVTGQPVTGQPVTGQPVTGQTVTEQTGQAVTGLTTTALTKTKSDTVDVTPQEAYLRPSTLDVPVEAILARHIVARTVIVGPVVIAVAWLSGGGLGAVSAAIGVAVVAANFVLSGVLMSWAAARSMKVYHAAALLGFFLRLGFIMAAVFLVANLFEVDRAALGIAAIVAYLALLTWEAVAVMNGSRKELEWTS